MKNLEKFTSQSFKRIVKSTPSNYSICSPNLEEQSKRQNKIITRRKKIVFSTWNNYSYCASDGNIFYHFVQFSHSVVSDSLRPHEPQHTRPPCPSPTPGVHPNPCPLCQWCHPVILSSVVPYSSCPQSFPASGSFQMSQLSASSGQSTGVLASTSVPKMNTQGWSPSEWTGWISLQSKGLSRVFSKTTVQKHPFFGAQLSSQSDSHIHTWLLEKP